MTSKPSPKAQVGHFPKAAHEAGTNLTKDKFARVIGGRANPPPSVSEAGPGKRTEKDGK